MNTPFVDHFCAPARTIESQSETTLAAPSAFLNFNFDQLQILPDLANTESKLYTYIPVEPDKGSRFIRTSRPSRWTFPQFESFPVKTTFERVEVKDGKVTRVVTLIHTLCEHATGKGTCDLNGLRCMDVTRHHGDVDSITSRTGEIVWQSINGRPHYDNVE